MKNIRDGVSRLLQQRGLRRKPPTLGARELEVMKILWRGAPLSAQAVLSEISHDDISLSTMQSTLERLNRKQLIAREKSGRFYLYHAVVSQSGIISQLLGEISEQIGDGKMAPMISGFMSFIDQEAPESFATEMRDAIQKVPADNDD
ncbi:BlaI/MecI/CopY family transcriptional regulator [Zhongshania aliphaticivorans]|uniref:BlaI/MecI/CopY family transcriptional regulator n=1 Tax=Zhongshania aliphaticivorans TaxID=1470434 RepID=UPI0012E5CB55|nr:BlaI/MecI/CopY family transcriptional regulator [Zhongshania aliphaticivorans]CAA0115664.1 Penicillinase repressor [Zhongshania aliphaticivorans]